MSEETYHLPNTNPQKLEEKIQEIKEKVENMNVVEEAYIRDAGWEGYVRLHINIEKIFIKED